MQNSLKLNSDTIILIDNFISKHFADKSTEQISELKKEALEIANALALQSDTSKEALKTELKEQLATKYDLQEVRSEMQEIKIDLIKWLITSQLMLAAVLIAVFALFVK